jgi:glyoxylase-like metal-dependent hydrolase (beta-lactamase superfamily II)
MPLSRRAVLACSALAAAACVAPAGPARPAALQSRIRSAGYYRYTLGSFEITALSDGVWQRPLDDKLIPGTPLSDVHKALADVYLPSATIPIPFTILVVNTGSKLVLLDTGSGGQFVSFAPLSGTFQANLAAAGIDPKSIDAVAISHFHPDHINGLRDKDGNHVFPNAEILVPSPEWDYWMDDANASAAPTAKVPQFRNSGRIFSDIAKTVTRFTPGREIAPGIAALPAYGHTPGHCAFMVTSGNASLLVLADTASNPWVFVRYPEWQGSFDVDGPLAVETRKRLLDRAAADRMLVHGYHFPFPAFGYIARTGKGYDFVPATWQPSL